MKKIAIFTLLWTLLTLPTQIRSAIGCMDTSHHLAKAYDTKNLHYVHCTCACSQKVVVQQRGKCITCSHYHLPKEWMVVRGTQEIMKVGQYTRAGHEETSSLSPESQKVIKQLVARYKKQK